MNELPDDVGRFLEDNITSVAQLEALLLLREDRRREWSVDEVSRELYAAASGMADQLNDLVAKGLALTAQAADLGPRFRYRPEDGGEADATIGRIADYYKERQVSVISSIYSDPLNKARKLADAFRFRKEKKER